MKIGRHMSKLWAERKWALFWDTVYTCTWLHVFMFIICAMVCLLLWFYMVRIIMMRCLFNVFSTTLRCNYIAIKCKNSGVYQYAVAFSPEVDSLRMRYKLVDDQRSRDIIGNVRAFDGRILFLPVQLKNLVFFFIHFIVWYKLVKFYQGHFGVLCPTRAILGLFCKNSIFCTIWVVLAVFGLFRLFASFWLCGVIIIYFFHFLAFSDNFVYFSNIWVCWGLLLSV